MVDLKTGLRIAPSSPLAYSITSPPLVVNGLVITGSSVADNTRPDLPSGEVRAYDARTGALRWSWDPCRRTQTDPAYGEWRGPDVHARTGAANAWSVLAGDADRDLVFVPTGSAAPDYYGGLRLGDNRYANSLVALNASTGALVWAFQTVHHDLWDYDNASPPALVTLTREGKPRPGDRSGHEDRDAVRAESRDGCSGVPRRGAAGSRRAMIPGEEAARTQPFTDCHAAAQPASLSLDDVWGISEADREACRTRSRLAQRRHLHAAEPAGTLVLPSNIGGAHWGGVAIDPVRQIAVVPVNRLAAMVQLLPREGLRPGARKKPENGGWATTTNTT